MAKKGKMEAPYAMGFRFKVTFELDSGKPLDLFFQKASSLSVSRDAEKVMLADGAKHANRRAFSPLTLTRGMSAKEEANWEKLKEMLYQRINGQKKIKPLVLTLSNLGEDEKALRTWKFHNAYVTNWTLTEHDAGKTDILLETLELTYSEMRTIK